MNYYLKFIFVLITCWLATSTVISQETLEEKKVRADAFFQAKDWSKAEPLYASVISNSPKNHDLNFRYGTCILNGSKNKEEAIRRLRFAITGLGIDKRAYYYLGRAYHLNYQFNDAIKQYTKFKQLASSSDLKELNVEADIKACGYGKKLLSNITDMVVLQKTELNEANFYDLYNLEGIGGEIIVTDIFQSKLDKKRNHRPVIHFPANSPYIYYSSYGEDGKTGLDIYAIKKLPGGEWSLAQRVIGNVNTVLDEDFAYMHPNGNYLYFCSKGHNSMGGYDVFRSKYNPNDQSFGSPENLDFAISSPDDDLFFVVDSLDRMAYFSSARASGDGQLTVYKVRVDRIPMQMAVIKGNYLNTIDGDNKEIEIEVQDFSSGRIIGTFNSKKTNGDYLMTFPKSGKYKYIMKPKDSDFAHTFTIDIPRTKEFKPLKQSITLKMGDDGEEYIDVDDQFSEEFDDPSAIMAEVYRTLSELIPNAQDFNIDSLDALKNTDKIFVDAGLDPFTSQNGLETILIDEIDGLTFSKVEEEKQANIAYNVAQEKSNLANEKMVELNKLLTQAENTNDALEKAKILQEVLKTKKEIADLNNEAQSLIDLAETIEISVANKEKRITETTNVLSKVNAIADEDREGLTNLISENKTFFIDNIKGNPELNSVVTDALQKGANEQKKVQKLSEEISTLSKEQRKLIAQNKQLNEQLKTEKKKKVIAELKSEIESNEFDLATLENAIENKTKELNEAINENASVRNGIAAAIVLKDDYANSAYEKSLTNQEKTVIANTVQSNNLEESLALVDTVLEENDVSAFNIDLYANSDETSQYSMQEWDEAIDVEAERLRQEKLAASEERKRQLQKEIDRLEKLRQEKMAQFDVVEKDPETIKSEISQNDILPNYTKKQEGIDEIVNEADRKKARLDLNYQLVEEIEKERKQLEEILENNPKAKNIKDRLNNLDNIENDIKSKIASDEEWIVENDNTDTFDPNEVLSDLAPNYQQKINDAYDIVDDTERTKTITELNEVVLEKANERIQELQAVLATDPDNEKAENELVYLQNYIKEINSNKGIALVEPSALNIDDLKADVVVTDLIRNYDSRKKIIDGITDEYKRKQEENKLYKEVIDNARNELAKLDRLAEENSGNKTIKKRQDALRSIDSDYNKLINKNEDWLAKNKPEIPQYADSKLIHNVYPTYQTEIDKINKNLNPSDRDQSIKELNEATLDKIDLRIGDIEGLINQDPNKLELYTERDELTALRKTIKSNKNNPLLEPTNENNINTKPTIADLMPLYDNEMANIENSNNIDTDKEYDKIDINEQLILLLNKELSNVADLKNLNPDLSEKLDERKNALINLKTTTQDKIEKSKSIINGQDTIVSRPKASIAALMPSYEKDLALIKQTDKSKKEQLSEENQLHQMLIAAIDYQTSKLETEKEENPDLTTIISGEIETFEKIKADKNAEITANKLAMENTDIDIVAERPSITTTSLMTDYDEQLNAIKNSTDTEIVKLEKENELNKKLVVLAQNRIAQLEIEKTQNPEQIELIDKDIASLSALIDAKQAEINNNEVALTELASLPENRATVSIDALLPNYNQELTDIKNGAGTDIEKLKKENDLHNRLIEVAVSKVTSLKSEKETNQAQEVAIEKDIEKAKNIVRATQNSININDDQLTQLGANRLDRPIITIGTLMSDFDDRLAEIENSDKTDVEKLEKKNDLNNELLRTISTKIDQVQEEWEEDPNNGFTYSQEIDKLEELKESKRNEIARNNEEIDLINGDTADVADVKTTSFSTDEGKIAVADFEDELNEINELNSDLNSLTSELNETSDDKEKNKIQKKIDNITEDKAKLENKVIEGLKDVNEIEIQTAKNELELDKEITSISSQAADNGLQEDLITAKEELIIADQKMAEANQLRNEASTEKDPLIANEKLKEAFDLENEAKDLIKESKRRFKMARAVNKYATEDFVITKVPDNVSDRKSTEKFDDAAELRKQANAYYDRATQLRDSSQTVKKKYKEAIVAKADAVEAKADILNQEANKIETIAEELKLQEDVLLDNKIDSIDKIADAKTIEETATTETYKNYYEAKQTGDDKLNQAENIDDQIGELKNKRTRKFKKAFAVNSNNLDEAVSNDSEITDTQTKIDSLINEQKRLRNEALQNYQQAKEILNNQTPNEQEDLMALAQQNIEPFERKVEIISADFEVPTNLNSDIFRTTDNAVYSEESRIPVGEKQPSGLVYKVQVGAFRKALPQDHFKEFAPISGERLNNGITRYMVGYFTTFSPANEAKTKVNGIGYSDAFVVAYCNGERITIDRAVLIEQGLIKCEANDTQDEIDTLTFNNTTDNTNTNDTNNTTDNTNNTNDNTDNVNTTNTNDINNTTDNTNTTNTNDTNNTTDNTNDNNDNTNNTTSTENTTTYIDQSEQLDFTAKTVEEERLTDYYTSVPNAAKANQIEIIEELFYTVQIGVYSKPVPNSALLNIQPLNSQQTSNGYIRYSTGIFSSEAAAIARKEEVVQIGISDAFVTAYYKGKRITPEEALKVLIDEGAEVVVGYKDEGAIAAENNDATDNVDEGVYNKEGLFYRLFLGKYNDAIPGEYATLLIQGDNVIETEVDADGNTCLISTKINSYDEMIDRIAEFKDLGIQDMEIISYYKYDVIPFDEGEKIRNNQDLETLHPYDKTQGISANRFIYIKEAVYFKVKIGEFEEKIPAEFTNLLLLHQEEENIDKEETVGDETIFYTKSITSYKEAEIVKQRLLDKGFDRAVILAYHKYDEISIEKAKEILSE